MGAFQNFAKLAKKRKKMTKSEYIALCEAQWEKIEKIKATSTLYEHEKQLDAMLVNFGKELLKQSHVSHWLKVLRPLLQKAIEDLHCQPAQDMDELIRLFRQRRDGADSDQGYRPAGVHCMEPFKARRKHPLSPFQKQYNTWCNSMRSVVEHAIGGVKRLALLTQPMRYWKQEVRHQIFVIGCGLHNLRVRFRTRAYVRGAQRVRAHLTS